MLKQLVLSFTLLAAATAAQARIHSLQPFQDITQLDADGNRLTSSVGIDGDSIILVTYVGTGTRAKLLRQGSGGRWVESRVLSELTLPTDEVAYGVEMKNGIAAVRISTHRILILERIKNDWIQTDVLDNPDYTGSLNVSGARIMVGVAGCNEKPDFLIFEKNITAGRWQVTGRIDLHSSACNAAASVDLNNTTATFHMPNSLEVRVFRRNGSALDWAQSATFMLPNESFNPPLFGSVVVQGSVAVATRLNYFRNTNGAWNLAGHIYPVNYASGAGDGEGLVYRDGILLSTDYQPGYQALNRLYVYAPNAAGGLDHVAILETAYNPDSYDISGRTVVVHSSEYFHPDVPPVTEVFTLPNPLLAPEAIAQDFESRDVSGFAQQGNAAFALVGAGAGYVFRSAAGGNAVAVLNDSQWRGHENVEADLKPLAVASGDPWAGLALRYADANNYYVASIRGSNRLRLERKVAGTIYQIAEVALSFQLNETQHLSFTASGKHLTAVVTGSGGRVEVSADDTAFGAGSVALLTSRARVDFDNVIARPTPAVTLLDKDWQDYQVYGRPFNFSGGQWEGVDGYANMAQTDTTGNASAVIGVPVKDQNVISRLRLDSFGSTNPVSSFSLLARYVDARTYYSLSVRSSGQLQIRKTVGGTTTVLKSASFTPGSDYRFYELRVVGHELHAHVDGALVLAAQDGDIATGIYGLSTYRAAISTNLVRVDQP
jgi:hypothetical protein